MKTALLALATFGVVFAVLARRETRLLRTATQRRPGVEVGEVGAP